MSVGGVRQLRASAAAIGITEEEWDALRCASCADTPMFYLELRRTLASEYVERRPFHLPARQLAAQPFLLHRRDRKLYMRMIRELLGLGLIMCVTRAGFSAEGRRAAAVYMFKAARAKTTSKTTIVFLAEYRRGNLTA